MLSSTLKQAAFQQWNTFKQKRDRQKFAGYEAMYLSPPELNAYQPETEFVAEDGRRIPVYSNYRYKVKRAWKDFAGLTLLHHFKAKGLLSEEDAKFANDCVGTRTIMQPLSEIERRAIAVAAKHPEMMIPQSITGNSVPLLKPDLEAAQATVSFYRDYYLCLFKRFSNYGFNVKPNSKVLEVGFSSGGHSIFALEQLGMRAEGIDNSFYGADGPYLLPAYFKDQFKSSVTFHAGDITQRTAFEDESFDIVVSNAVLEHIKDLPGFFAESKRILKRDGLFIASYNPYFCHNGGHSAGTLDSPWAHVRLSERDCLRYVKELRPYEVEYAENWIPTSLNRNHPIHVVQNSLVNAGFEIRLWEEKSSPRQFIADLTPEIIRDCQNMVPGLTLADLSSESILFIGTKTLHGVN